MTSAYTQNYYHLVFSSKGRTYFIKPELESRLFAYIGVIARDLRCQPLGINGMPDHAHLLIRYRADLSISDMVRHIKGRSSKWIHETSPAYAAFSWQEGYGGFTVSRSVVPEVEAYIVRQKDHHQRQGLPDGVPFRNIDSRRIDCRIRPSPSGSHRRLGPDATGREARRLVTPSPHPSAGQAPSWRDSPWTSKARDVTGAVMTGARPCGVLGVMIKRSEAVDGRRIALGRDLRFKGR